MKGRGRGVEKAALRGERGKRDLRHTNKEFSPRPLTYTLSSSFQCSIRLFGFLFKTDKFGVRTTRRGNRWGGDGGGRLEGKRRGKKVFGEQTGGGGHQTEKVVEEEEGAVGKSDGCAVVWKSPKKQQLKGKLTGGSSQPMHTGIKVENMGE